MQRGRDYLQFFAITRQLLCTAKECPNLSDISWDTQVADGAQVCVLGFHPMFRYGVVVEGDFLDAEFNFGGFDLYACFCTAALKGFIGVFDTMHTRFCIIISILYTMRT